MALSVKVRLHLSAGFFIGVSATSISRSISTYATAGAGQGVSTQTARRHYGSLTSKTALVTGASGSS
eukprot:6231136-Prymnesium_polylepis.1